jgi:histone arginine demethylase JMJD6
MMSLSTYAKYITNPEGMLDDSPLGIYDSEFGDDTSSPISDLLKEYCVPECFSRDLFELVEDYDEDNGIKSNGSEDDDATNPSTNTRSPTRTRTARPPYRWILIGPERSGTGMHVDPLWTNAWVTVLQGQKQWLLFPPETPYDSIGMIKGTPQIPSSIWFRDFYDVVTSPSWPKQYRPVEVLQNPGETVFVPAGWPHLVLNLELTVAVTHNYASEYGPHFDRMWEEVGRDEPDFAARWLAGLRKHGRDDLTARCYGMRH